ncbi:hypothetical protein ACIPUD_19980 [Bradyrhizobium sp. CAR08]
MSAANIIVASDGAHLISDSLVWDTADQTVTAICNKVIMLPQLKAAATIRAEHFMVFQAVSLALSTMIARDFDEFRAKIRDTLMELDERLAELGHRSPFEVSVIGISESNGPTGFRITTLSAPITSEQIVQPWQIVEMPRGFNPCPCNSEAEEREIRQALTVAPASLDGHAVAALTAQREIARRDFEAGRQPCFIGGFAQLTTVTRDAVTSRIIHRWPDVVGERVAA